jgi:hypothetical protein
MQLEMITDIHGLSLYYINSPSIILQVKKIKNSYSIYQDWGIII